MPLQNRFAISALSRHNKDSAFPEELLVHKQTGEMLIKTPDGDIISYDKISRMRNHIDKVTNVCYNLGINGSINSLESDIIEFPEIITDEINLLTQPLILATTMINKLLISIDIDCVEMGSIIEFDPIINIELSIQKGEDIPIVYNTSLSVTENNNKIILPNNLIPITTELYVYNIKLNKISITRNPLVDVERPIKNIVHSVLIVVQKV